MVRRTAPFAALLVLLAACGTAQSPAASDTPTVTDPPTGSETPAPEGARVVYVTFGDHLQDEPGEPDLWLYDAVTDRTRRLTTDGDEIVETHPLFRDEGHVTFLMSTDNEGMQVMEIDLAAEAHTFVVATERHAWSVDWDADGERLAMIVDVLRGDALRKAVQVYSRATGRTRTIFDLPPNVGRGGVPEDEIAARWSPDGRYLSVVDTAGEQSAPGDSDREPPITVIDASGDVVLDGIAGTLARWSPDSKGIYFRPYNPGGGTDWQFANVRTGEITDAGIEMQGAIYAAVSPDGRFVAVSQDSPDTTVRIADMTHEQDELIYAREAVAPIWLSPTEIAVTPVEPCAPCGEYPTWRIAGRALAVDVTTMERRRLDLHHTGVFGAADVWLAN